MILVSRNMIYVDIRRGFSGRGRQTTVGLSKTVIFIAFSSLAICSGTLDRISRIYNMYRIYSPSTAFQ